MVILFVSYEKRTATYVLMSMRFLGPMCGNPRTVNFAMIPFSENTHDTPYRVNVQVEETSRQHQGVLVHGPHTKTKLFLCQPEVGFNLNGHPVKLFLYETKLYRDYILCPSIFWGPRLIARSPRHRWREKNLEPQKIDGLSI